MGVAELATLSMEFTRLEQLTAQDKYYDAIDRITNALVDLQMQGTLVPGMFPETLDASGCNRTATSARDSLSQAAREQVDYTVPLSDPVGFNAQSKGGARSPLGFGGQVEPSAASEGHTGASKTRAKRDGPFAADGKKSKWDCVPQGLVPRGYGLQKFHVGGGQDSAYEYFPKVGPLR